MLARRVHNDYFETNPNLPQSSVDLLRQRKVNHPRNRHAAHTPISDPKSIVLYCTEPRRRLAGVWQRPEMTFTVARFTLQFLNPFFYCEQVGWY